MANYQAAKDQLIADIAAAGTASDTLLLSQSLVEISSAEAVDVEDYDTRLKVVESSKTQANRLTGKRIPHGFRATGHNLYSRGTDEQFLFLIPLSGTSRCLFSPNGGDSWYWWELNVSRDNYEYDVIVNEADGTFNVFWETSSIIYESGFISYTDMINNNFVPQVNAGVAITTNTTKGGYFGVAYHKDGHMVLVYGNQTTAAATDICSMTKPSGGAWGAETVRLPHQWDGATGYYHERIKTKMLHNSTNDAFYFGTDANNTTTANYARYGIFKLVWDGVSEFTFTRLGMDSLNAAPYYLGSQCSLYLINDANDANKEKLVIVPTNDGNGLDRVYLVNTDTFNAFVNTGIDINSDPNTYTWYPLPKGQMMRGDWYYTNDWGLNWQIIGYNHAAWQVNQHAHQCAGRFRTYSGYNSEYRITDLHSYER